MRAGSRSVALILLAGCGPSGPPSPPPEALAARAAAEDWKREGPAEGIDAVAADQALARADRLLAAGTPDVEGFRAAEAAYRDAISKVRGAREAKRDRAYRDALDARSRARALRTRLDERRAAISASAAMPGREGTYWASVRDVASKRVFTSDKMLATDVALEKADALFSDGHHEEARETFGKAATDLESLIERIAEAEAEARAGETLGEAERAVGAMRTRVGKTRPPSARRAEEALDAARRAAAERDFARVAERAGEAKRFVEKALQHDAALDAAKVDRSAAQRALAEWTAAGEAENSRSKAGREQMRAGEAQLDEDPAAASASFEAASASFLAALAESRSALRTRLAQLRVKKEPPPLPPDPLDTKRTAEAVRLALDWLARHQDDDGRWSCNDFIRHDPRGLDRADTGGPLYDTGVTGLALLCFLEAGYSDRGDGERGYYNVNVEQGLRWLKEAQADDGVFGTRATHHFMYNHAIAALAMCEACRRSKDPRQKKSAEIAVRFIEHVRNPDLAWRYEPRGGESDTSVTVWCVEALAAAQAAGIDVDAAAWRGALAWVDSMTDADGRVGYNTRGGSPSRPEKAIARFPPERSESMTAAGILVRVLCRESPPKSGVIASGTTLIFDQPPLWVPESGTVDMYYWRCASRALRLSKCPDWYRWSELVQKVGFRWQVPASGAHNAGSWDPVDPWGEDGGRVYSTAMMTLTLLESARTTE